MSECGVKEFKLRELLKIYNGTKYDHLNKGDFPLYGSGGLMSHVDEALYSGEAILLPRKGTLSNIMYVNESFWTVDTMYYAVVNDKFADAFYLYSYLSQLDLSNLDSGSTLPSMTKSAYESIVVKLPDLKIQKAVATILFNIRKKLETNNQINQELEAMAKTLYDYWFVQFDFPDQNGKPYKSSGGKMVYHPELKREIPEGWGVDSLWNIANFYNGLAMQKYRPDTNEDDYLPVIKIREMMNGFSKDTEKARLDIPTEAVVERGDILFSWSATLEVIIWGKEKGALNQHIFKVTSDTYPKSFIYFELKSYLKVFKSIAELRKTTMGHITQDHLKQAKIVVPPIEIISKIDAQLQHIMSQQQILENQNQQLTQLRDWLLPMLMNGQVKVE
ncbi:restriction endonuclease subunit S [Streptococcus infantis]|uniref:restriction endonuclease subunit S n=1 Tax=Streptococcus infantis TaxID=68892 RepID=UPI0039C1DAEE